MALHERRGEAAEAAACFEGATQPALLKAKASFAAKHGRWAEAADAHQKLLSANPRDLQALAGLVLEHAPLHVHPRTSLMCMACALHVYTHRRSRAS